MTEMGTDELGPALALGGQRSCVGSRPGAAWHPSMAQHGMQPAPIAALLVALPGWADFRTLQNEAPELHFGAGKYPQHPQHSGIRSIGMLLPLTHGLWSWGRGDAASRAQHCFREGPTVTAWLAHWAGGGVPLQTPRNRVIPGKATGVEVIQPMFEI